MARCGPPVVRLPRYQGHQQADPGCSAADADGDESPGQGAAQEKRGRKGAKSKAAAARRGMTVKEKANFVFKHRHLIVKRRENLAESESGNLARMLEYLPELATLRRFSDRIYWVFDTSKDFHQASCRPGPRSCVIRRSRLWLADQHVSTPCTPLVRRTPAAPSTTVIDT